MLELPPIATLAYFGICEELKLDFIFVIVRGFGENLN
jgi:hypothetical protein